MLLDDDERRRFIDVYESIAADVLGLPPSAIRVTADDDTGSGNILVRLYIDGEPASRYDAALVNVEVRRRRLLH